MEDNIFDHGEKIAIDLLFKSFCNNLYLGQWYLAKSCVNELYTRKNETGINIRDVLISLAKHPYGAR